MSTDRGDIREVIQSRQTPSPSTQLDRSSTHSRTFDQVDINSTHTFNDRSRDCREDDEEHRSCIGEKEVGRLITWDPLPSGPSLSLRCGELRGWCGGGPEGSSEVSILGDDSDWSGGKVSHCYYSLLVELVKRVLVCSQVDKDKHDANAFPYIRPQNGTKDRTFYS